MSTENIIENLHPMWPELERRYHLLRGLLVAAGNGEQIEDVELGLAVNDLNSVLETISPEELDD